MKANEIYPIALLVCVLFALVVMRKLNKPASSTNEGANEVVPKTNARLNRIQKISKVVRLFLQYGMPLTILVVIALGYLATTQKITLSEPPHLPGTNSVSNPRAGTSELWSIFSLVVYLFWYRTALKLFGFFERGILFTSETVRCIKILGGIYFARFLMQLGLYVFAPTQTSDFFGPGLSDLYTGFLIVFIGWLIDEARKIREEQELTV